MLSLFLWGRRRRAPCCFTQAQPPACGSTDQGPFLSRVAASNTIPWLLLPLAGGTQSCVPSREHILPWRKVPLPHACCWHSAGSCEEARDLKRRSYSYRNRLKPSIFLKLKKKKNPESQAYSHQLLALQAGQGIQPCLHPHPDPSEFKRRVMCISSTEAETKLFMSLLEKQMQSS